MKVENNYTDIFHLMEFIENTKIKDVETISSLTDTIAVSNLNFIGHNFSLGVWVTQNTFSFHEFGFNSVPYTVIDLKDISFIEFENGVLTIYKSSNEVIVLDLETLNTPKSTFVIV